MSEKENVVEWLRRAKQEIEFHAEWERMPESWAKARARQARDMASDIETVIQKQNGEVTKKCW